MSQNKEQRENAIIRRALRIMEERARYAEGPLFTNPNSTKDYLRLRLAGRESEVFSVLFMDNQHRMIAYEGLFQGTIDGVSVYPREVVKAALKHNAAAVILTHNHPSGIAEPSRSDQVITKMMKDALGLVEVRVLDHIVVGEEITSMAERGLL